MTNQVTSTSHVQRIMSTESKSRAELNYAARVDLATAYRACTRYDLNRAIFNHLTQRAPARNGEGDVMLVIPHGLLWSEVTASCLIGVDFETGKVVEGEGQIADTANAIHRAIHKTRYPIDGITSVMHTHQPYSTALACTDDPEPFKYGLGQFSMAFYGRIAYDYGYTGVALADEEGYRLAKVLGDKNVLMMGNHGVLTVAKQTWTAFILLYYVEESAKNQVLAQSTGMKLRLAPQELVNKMSARKHEDDKGFALFFDTLKTLFTNQKPCVMD